MLYVVNVVTRASSSWKGNPPFISRAEPVVLFKFLKLILLTFMSTDLKARTRSDYAYFLSYKTRWLAFVFSLSGFAFEV